MTYRIHETNNLFLRIIFKYTIFTWIFISAEMRSQNEMCPQQSVLHQLF